MPIYEYQCANCDHQFDLMQNINEPAATLCPKCSQEKLVKLMSVGGFQLKGTGWYVTDFKNKGASSANNSASTATSSVSSESSGSGSKES